MSSNLSIEETIMKVIFWVTMISMLVFSNPLVLQADTPLSEATPECMDCHNQIHPGIVKAWQMPLKIISMKVSKKSRRTYGSFMPTPFAFPPPWAVVVIMLFTPGVTINSTRPLLKWMNG